MSDNGEPRNLEELLDRIGEAASDHDPVNIDMIVDEVGLLALVLMAVTVSLAAYHLL